MSKSKTPLWVYIAILAFGVSAPTLFPAYTFQVAFLWIMILFALTWDVMGGQMGYNSLGNIFFFGAGMYITAVTQVALFTDVGEYTSAVGADQLVLAMPEFMWSLGLGLALAALGSVLLAVILGWVMFGLRGPYFAIGTLGVALAGAELISAWEWVGGGGGIAIPVFPGEAGGKSIFFYWACFILAVLCFAFLRWLYSTRFGLAINAIRDDESKAEAMGIHTRRHKICAWAISAFFLGIVGGLFGHMTGFIEPLEVAFPTITFGIFMVAMSLLGGKGTLWGPVLGATLFHFIKELTWTYLLGWQWVALGMIIIINIVFFQQGIVGWLMDKYPERFGLTVDEQGPESREAAQ